MSNTNKVSFSGTAKDFESNNVLINGVKVDALALPMLAKFGFVKVTGTVARTEKQRGKSANIYLVETTDGVEVSL